MNRLLKIITFPIRKPAQLVKQKVRDSVSGAIAGVIRHALTTLGGALVTNGTISDSDLQAVIGAIITLFGITWSVLSKREKRGY